MKKSLAMVLPLLLLLGSSLGVSLTLAGDKSDGAARRLVRSGEPLAISPRVRGAIQLFMEARHRRMIEASPAEEFDRELAKTPAVVGQALIALQRGEPDALRPVEAEATRLESLFETLQEQDGSRPERAGVLAVQGPKVESLVSALRDTARASSPSLQDAGLRQLLIRLQDDLRPGPNFPRRLGDPTVRSLDFVP